MEKYMLSIALIINISVTGGDEFGSNSQIELMKDMSNTCIDDLHTNIYLTFGMGVSDAVVVIISDNDLYPNCEITIYTAGSYNSVYLIVVVEFPDHTEGPNNACQDPNSNIYVKEPTLVKKINVCNEVNKRKFGYFVTPVYSMISSSRNVSVKIVSKSLFETVKITATSARKLNQYERCDFSREVLCMISNVSVCISRELECDENINCGTANINDEDVRICDEGRYKRLWLVVLGGTVMTMIIVFFLIHLLRTCLPAVPDSFFIFNEDEDNKLILLTKYTSPPESLRQVAQGKLQPQSSSFRFKTVPVTQPHDIVPRGRRISIGEETNVSIPSEDYEIELESHLYKDETKREVGELKRTVPPKKKPEEIQKAREELAPKQTSSKRPRFEKDVIHIMDYTDAPSSKESLDTEQLPKQKEKKKSVRREQPAVSGRERTDTSSGESQKQDKRLM